MCDFLEKVGRPGPRKIRLSDEVAVSEEFAHESQVVTENVNGETRARTVEAPCAGLAARRLRGKRETGNLRFRWESWDLA